MEKNRFYGSRLRIARIIRGHTQTELGRRIGANVSTISRLETGLLEPTPGLVTALSDELDFATSFFERPIIDEYTLNNCSFRSSSATPRRKHDQALARGTAFQEAVSALAMMVQLPPAALKPMKAHNVQEIEAAAEMLRISFDLSLRAPIASVIQLAEHAGIVVTRMRGPVEQVDAFSHYGTPPVIMLPVTNNDGAIDRVKVAHEIGHLIMGLTHVNTADAEQAAERFALALLMPAQVFRDEFGVLPRVDWPHLFELKRRWKVPAFDILNRALQLDFVSATTVRRLQKQYSWRRWHQAEPYRVPLEEPELLALALDFAERDTGETLATLAETLGWGPTVAEELTGMAMPDWDVFSGANVARLDDYRRA
ncbi:MAG TPA: XRE family transcriptional regulator [Thermoanaerobaculia bacterium]|jgi:Zn-dependent peptidase ImmA (M78 family)/DNA-binding XRE family transcriptional regulator|nr:XRE family transcriptional regulator [Thermoanaerobaculia bacterium]